MTLHWLDYAIIAGYLAMLVGVAVVVARRASASSDDYFLAGKKLPWWALGASGMSSNLDAAGTMTIIALIYLYGLHGFFIEMRGGVVLPIAVFLAFMGKWHQRSQVVTTGEWMLLRFGEGWQGRLARFAAAGTYVVITVGMVVFFLAAAGKFLAVFLPFDATTCSVAMALLALGYTMVSGLYGVIWTDVFQAFLIGLGAIYVSVLAAGYVTPELIEQWPGAVYNQWSPSILSGEQGLIDTRGGEFDPKSGVFVSRFQHKERYAPFLLFLLFWAGKGILEGLGGSGGSAYMAQRFYASRDVPTVKKLCMLWTVLFAFRWPMVLGFAILAIHLGIGGEDPETILPGVITSDLIPVGITGVLIASIFAASMSTFDSTLNAGASYVVRDVYNVLASKKTDATEGEAFCGKCGYTLAGSAEADACPECGASLPEHATTSRLPSEKAQVRVGWLACVAIVALGLTLQLAFAGNVLGVWVAIVIQLFPAFLIPFALRWFWSRFNGLGFALGIAFGFAAAFGLTFVEPGDVFHYNKTIGAGETARVTPDEFGVLLQNGAFTDIFILGCVGLSSLIGCLLGTLVAPNTDRGALKRFYDQVRPFGLWPRDWKARDRREHRFDLIRLAAALTWQVTTFLLPMLAVLRMWGSFAVLAAVWLPLLVYLLRDSGGVPGTREGARPVDV